MPAIFGNTPQPTTVPLDSGSQGLLNQDTTLANQSNSAYAGILNNGISEGAHSLSQSDAQMNQEGQRNSLDPNYLASLRSAYGQQANSAIQRIKSQNDYNGAMMKADFMQKMAGTLLGQQQAQVQNYSFLTNAYNQSEQARAALINSLFQMSNTGMATMAANSSAPAPNMTGEGRQTGSQVGSQIGSQVGMPQSAGSVNYGGSYGEQFGNSNTYA